MLAAPWQRRGPQWARPLAGQVVAGSYPLTPTGHGGWGAPASPAGALAGQLTVDSDARDDSRLNWRWL
jgi:hypothetical protein